jgi:hypothetical protein
MKERKFSMFGHGKTRDETAQGRLRDSMVRERIIQKWRCNNF